MTAKDYIQELGIEDEIIYDNAERMHSLECLLEDYYQRQLKLLGLHGVVKRYTKEDLDNAYEEGLKEGYSCIPKNM